LDPPNYSLYYNVGFWKSQVIWTKRFFWLFRGTPIKTHSLSLVYGGVGFIGVEFPRITTPGAGVTMNIAFRYRMGTASTKQNTEGD